jgi:hypothetical protein
VAFPVEAFVLLRRTNQVDSTLVPAQGDSIHMLVPRLMSAPKDFWGPAPSEADVRRRLSALIALSRQAPGHGLYLGHDLKQAGTLVTRLAKAHALSAPAVVVTAP